MELQQCTQCKDDYPLWMIMHLDAIRICKICILSGQIKANKDKIDEIKLDVDLLTGRVNETNMYADDTNGMRREIRLIEERVKSIENEDLNFSGFTKPDFTKVYEERKEEKDDERKSWDDVAEENNDLEVLAEDVRNMVTSGIKEIREKICDRQEKEENKKCSFSQSLVVGTETGKRENSYNRYCVLEEDNGEGEEEKKYEILGNAEVRHMRERTKKGGKRGIYSTNGAGIVNILEHIKNKQMEGKTTVIHGGGDDIKKLETEHMLRTYKEAIREIKEKGKLCIVSGILPRRGESSYWSSRAIGMNDRLQKYCKEMDGVMFIDNWTRFYGNRKLYATDGIHLSRQGTNLLSVIIEEKVEINSNLDKRRRRENVT